MIFKMISKEVRKLENSYLHDNFLVKNDFLFYRGVKICKCRYKSVFYKNTLFIEKDNIVETYKLEIDTDLTTYDIHEGLLRVFDDEDNILKIFTFDEIKEINDGIILKGNRTLFLKSNGDELEIKSILNVDEAIVGCLPEPFNLLKKRKSNFQPSNYNITLSHNILHLEIIIKDNLYAFKDDQQEDENHLFSRIDEDEYYMVKTSGKETVYNRTGSLVLFLNGIFLCKDVLPIRSIVMTSFFDIGGRNIIIIVTINHIFMIYEDMISYKNHSEIIYRISIDQNISLIPKAFTMNGTIPLHDLYLTLTLFSDLPIVEDGLQSFLFDLFIFTDLADNFIRKIFQKEETNLQIETVLCNIYRLVDDKCKRVIDKHIFGRPILNINNMKKIIIFHPDFIPEYIERCISEHKEYEIEVLIEHYRDTCFLKLIAYELLRYNCFYLFTQCYPEYENQFDENILKVEKYNLMSQRNRK